MMQKKKSRELLQIFKLYYGNNLIDKIPTMKKRERILIIASLFSPVIFAQEIPLKKVSDNDIQSCRTFPVIKDRVMNDRLDRNSKGIYRIGDYYNVDGKEGIVFYVDDTGKHGKIISMQTTILPWSTINTLTGANDMYDGRKNMEIIRKIPNWEQQFPAFNYCYNHLGHQWYLPAYYELKQIYINKNILVKALEANGGDGMLDNTHYSSSELSRTEAWMIMTQFDDAIYEEVGEFMGYEMDLRGYEKQGNDGSIRAISIF